MLKLILDTNLFRTDLKGLEKYEFSSLYEKIIEYTKNNKFQDVSLCMPETAIKEYVKQIADQYQVKVVDGYTTAFNIMKDSLPVFEIKFRDKYDFMDEYLVGMLDRLKQSNIEIIDTLPTKQLGGMKMVDVLNKTIKDIAPFDKKHNHNLKDAFISETVNSQATVDIEHEYLLVTCNAKDFKCNTDVANNYKMEFLETNASDKILSIIEIIRNHGGYVDEELFYEEFLYSQRVKENIKNFLEINIIEGQYYGDSIPEIEKFDDCHYLLSYEVDADKTMIDIKFNIVAGESKHLAGIIYSLNEKEYPILKKYVYYTDESGEEVPDEF